jgi:membrane associated rhomboid family serine protease
VEQGRLGVATIYLGGGVCGALGASLLQPNLYLVGASAGVYALLTSHLAHLYLVSEKVSQSLSTSLSEIRAIRCMPRQQRKGPQKKPRRS